MALSGPGTLDTERDRRLLNCTLRAQGQLTTVVEQRQSPGESRSQLPQPTHTTLHHAMSHAEDRQVRSHNRAHTPEAN